MDLIVNEAFDLSKQLMESQKHCARLCEEETAQIKDLEKVIEHEKMCSQFLKRQMHQLQSQIGELRLEVSKLEKMALIVGEIKITGQENKRPAEETSRSPRQVKRARYEERGEREYRINSTAVLDKMREMQIDEHVINLLIQHPHKIKTEVCAYYQKGYCEREARCTWIHGPYEYHFFVNQLVRE